MPFIYYCHHFAHKVQLTSHCVLLVKLCFKMHSFLATVIHKEMLKKMQASGELVS